MKRFLSTIFCLFFCIPVYAGEQTDFTFYRDPKNALIGTTSGSSYAFPGTALTASSWRLRGDLVNRPILHAQWMLVWNPNTVSGYTGVRLIKSDNGPSNMVEIARLTNNNYTSPRVDSVNITAALQDIVNNGQYKQILQQTAGNGTDGAMIYASWIEIIWGD